MPQRTRTGQLYPATRNITTPLATGDLQLDRLAQSMRARSREADSSGEIPHNTWQPQDVRPLNLTLVPAVYGGSPSLQSHVSRIAFMEHLGHADASLALALPGPGLAMPPVVALASSRQQAAFFHRFQSDVPQWGAFAITEPDCGSDATAMRTTARKTARGWVLNGAKCFITNGARANCVITFATLNRQAGRYGIRAFLVERDAPGFSITRIERMSGLRASQLAALSFTDCEVSDDALLARGDEKPLDDAFSGAQQSWDYFRPLLSSIMVGTCQRVRDELAAWLDAGGKPADGCARIADVDECLLDIDRQITSARLICHCTAWKSDHGIATSLDASMAKAYASRAAARITRTALDMAGIEGIAAHPALEQAYRDAKAFDIMEGTGDLQRQMIARAAQRATSLPWEFATAG